MLRLKPASPFVKMAGISALLLMMLPLAAQAHVKWFAHFSYADEPVDLSSAVTTEFIALLALSVVIVAFLAAIEHRLAQTFLFKKLDDFLAQIAVEPDIVIRIGLGAVMLLSWQDDALLVPELNHSASWLGWYQFGLALLLLFRKTAAISGLGLILLYVFGVEEFGVFHMLDYPLYIGVGYFLMAPFLPNAKLRNAAMPVLLATLGFSLSWVALEKIIYPQWGLYVLHHQPELTMGLNMAFFLKASAFIEFSLGFVVIIGLMKRQVALLITGVFFITTMTFGKVEVIGHTLIHAVLIVMLLDRRPAPERNQSRKLSQPLLRAAAVAGGYLLMFTALIFPYEKFAHMAYAAYHDPDDRVHRHVEVQHEDSHPTLDLEVLEDMHSGYNIRLKTTNFIFNPDSVGRNHVHGEGHAHLYINNVKYARVYNNWHHIDLRPGKYELTVTLNANDHRVYTIEGKPVMATHTLEVNPREAMSGMHH